MIETHNDSSVSESNPVLAHVKFLVVPILTIDSHNKEIKWSGSLSPGANDVVGNSIEMAINAFAHHTYEDSDKSLVFVDIQGIVNTAQKTVTLIDPQIHT